MKVGTSKVEKVQPVEVKYFENNEEVTFTLKIRVTTPLELNKFMKAARDAGTDYDTMAKANCLLVTDWEGVTDDEGNEIPYSEDALVDAQLEKWGLIDAIYMAQLNKSGELRNDALKKLEPPKRPNKKK